MEKLSGALKTAGDAMVQVAPAASVLARTGAAYSQSSTAADNLDSTRQQISLERSLAEARAAQDEAERARRFKAAASSSLALSAGRGVDLASLDGVDAGNREAYARDTKNIEMNRISQLLKLDFMEGDATRMATNASRNAWLTAAFGNADTIFRMGRREPTLRSTPQSGFQAPAGFATYSQRK